MPFTISHAAAVLPLSRTGLPLAALMIGSMSPDFAYFLPNGPGVLSHSVPGLFKFCWPTALLVWVVFVQLLETPTLALLPDGWRDVFPRSARALTVRNFALATHLILRRQYLRTPCSPFSQDRKNLRRLQTVGLTPL